MKTLSQTEKNKELVRTLLETVANRHDVQAAARYLTDGYIQHNPMAPTGRQAFIDFFTGWIKENPQLRVNIKRMIAEGDLVAVHSHWQTSPGDRGMAIVDIFRVADGKVAEHWDVIQPIPEQSANRNTMF